MRSLVFEGNSWEEYENLRKNNKKALDTLRKIIKELMRSDPTLGIGKPEPLKHDLSGF